MDAKFATPPGFWGANLDQLAGSPVWQALALVFALAACLMLAGWQFRR